MKRLILLAAMAMTLPACTGQHISSPGEKVVLVADAIYAVARTTGQQAVRLGAISQARFDELDARMQLILIGIGAGTATLAQLRAIADQMAGPAQAEPLPTID